jgi:hypothetical protein
MKNMLWISDPKKWAGLDILEQLELLRQHYCTGPCGQSSSVQKTREVTNETLKSAIESIQWSRDLAIERSFYD